MKIKRIFVPVDYSACSSVALRVAASLAEQLHATLDIVHVWDRPSYLGNAVLSSEKTPPGSSLFQRIEEQAQLDLRNYLSGISSKLSGRLVSGDPASALLQEIKAGKYELVVVGTHGRTGLSHLLLGSVAEKLVRLSPTPVLTVPGEVAKSLRN